MDLPPEISKKIQELQILEQGIQNFIAQKQLLQVELNESNNAIFELEKTGDSEIFRIVGNIMIKSKKKDIVKDLEEKKKTIELRVSSIEKQEKILEEKSNSLKEEINAVISKTKK